MTNPVHFGSSTGVNHNKSVSNGVTTGESFQSVVRSWTDTRLGSSLPSWRAQIKGHRSATTVASGLRREFTFGSGSVTVSNKTVRFSDGVQVGTASALSEGPTLLPGTLLSLAGDPSGLSTSSAIIAAKTQILGKIRGTYRQMQGGVFLGELRDTLRTIKHPLRAIRNGLDSYARTAKKRSARGGSVSNRNRIVQDTWLEYVFGWRPLINDINDIAKGLGSKDYREYIPVSGRGRSQSATTFNDVTTRNTIGIKRCWTVKSEASCWLRGEVGAGPSSTSVANLQRWGFGSWKEFVPTIYELIPYSFLVDYFTNTGSIIDAYSTELGGVRWINASIRVFNDVILQDVGPDSTYNATTWGGSSGPFDYIITNENGSYSGYVNRCTRFTRAPWVASDLRLDLYDFRFKLPGVGSMKWLNIAALLHLRR